MRYFVIRGFGFKTDSAGNKIDFDRVDHDLIAPALALCAFEGGTTAQVEEAGSIHEDMFALILEADVVVCDITVHNANVFYELGVRHALRRKHTVLIKGEPSADKTPFDIGGFRYIGYPIGNPSSTVDTLVGAIQSGLRGGRVTDSPVFHFLPALPEAPSNAAVPPDFTNEVKRAIAARDKGWLLMLAEDLHQLRFERAGLHQVAFAQFDLQDFEPARRNLERLLRMGDSDVRLHFKLANIYERMYRRTGKAEYFERSQQAIQTALQRSDDLPAPDHAEALSLRGRNLKTQWRMAFEKLPTLEERRRQACRRPLFDSHAAYQAAFRRDLNSFYSGIACLQAGQLLRSLSSEPGWSSMFKTTREAKRYAEELAEDLQDMVHVVAAAIAHGLEYGNANDRKWAAISEVDLHFLTDDYAALRADPSGLIAQYESALTGCEPFFRDAVIGQLELFASVGLCSDVAEAVVTSLRRTAPPTTAALRPHLVVFAGHAIDAPTRAVPRFPIAAELRARELILERLAALQARYPALVVLASAAPGADILLHELCAELGVPTVLCLPMPAKDVAAQSFGTLDSWRNRLAVVARRHVDDARLLQEGPELPCWLDPRKAELWERGNRWMIRSAEAWDCEGRTLLALWDRDEGNQATGGTAHLVRLARQAGIFEIDLIDSRELLVERAP